MACACIKGCQLFDNSSTGCYWSIGHPVSGSVRAHVCAHVLYLAIGANLTQCGFTMEKFELPNFEVSQSVVDAWVALLFVILRVLTPIVIFNAHIFTNVFQILINYEKSSD